MMSGIELFPGECVCQQECSTVRSGLPRFAALGGRSIDTIEAAGAATGGRLQSWPISIQSLRRNLKFAAADPQAWHSSAQPARLG